ncbi:MAG: hypothetical protein KBE04_09715 [Phycisphaerae bacterium]|nr:hypothetical protein [Phycisphaerae bacterium]
MSPTQALLWKEWAEHRWKMAFGTVMMASFSGALFAWGGISNRESMILILAVGCLLLSILNAMGSFAQEHNEGTALFLATRPMEIRKVFLCKWMVGWANTVIPLLACGLTLGVWFASSPHSGSVVRNLVPGTLAMTWIATVLYSLSCCATLRRGGPAIVGLTGLFWAGAMLLHLILADIFVGQRPTSLWDYLFLSANPLYVLALVDLPESLKNAGWLPMAAVLLEQGILLVLVLWVGLRNWKRSV